MAGTRAEVMTPREVTIRKVARTITAGMTRQSALRVLQLQLQVAATPQKVDTTSTTNTRELVAPTTTPVRIATTLAEPGMLKTLTPPRQSAAMDGQRTSMNRERRTITMNLPARPNGHSEDQYLVIEERNEMKKYTVFTYYMYY